MIKKQVWKEVWLVVDATQVIITKKRRENGGDDDGAPVHYNFPIAEVTTSRLSQLHHGFRICCGKEIVDLMVPAEELADKWLSCITWNQLVICRQQEHAS